MANAPSGTDTIADDMITVTLEFYGVLRGLAGTRSEAASFAAGTTAGEIRDAVGARSDALRQALRGVAIALDEKLVGSDTVVPDGAVVALLPPVSGG